MKITREQFETLKSTTMKRWGMWNSRMDISVLQGKTLTDIFVSEIKNRISFLAEDGQMFVMMHEQDCCEQVEIEDICGDLSDLIGTPIILAELITSNDSKGRDCESCTWSFYKLRTVKGDVTIRWWGESNGYYSEEVSFFRYTDKECS